MEVRLHTLPPSIITLLTQGEEDILTARAEKRSAAITFNPCPRCNGEMQQSLNPVHIFTPDEPLPRVLAECKSCGFSYDPHNGIIVEMGNPAKVKDPFAIPGLEEP